MLNTVIVIYHLCVQSHGVNVLVIFGMPVR